MTTISMPQFGESVTEGTIIRWLKQPGDAVVMDESLCEIETDKVTAELPSPIEGVLGEIHVAEGETVDIGTPICEITESSERNVVTTSPAAEGWQGGPMAIFDDAAEEAEHAEAGAVVSGTRTRTESRRPDERERFYSPVVIRLARKHGIDLEQVQGSGVGGRVTRKDVESLIAAQADAATERVRAEPATPPSTGDGYEVIQLSPTRRTIAERMRRSNLEAPQAWMMVEADVTRLVRWREKETERTGSGDVRETTLLAPFVSAVCESLRDHPHLNARWEGDELRLYSSLNIGIAVATDRGLMVPVIHNAGDLSIAGLAKQIADLARRARARELTVHDVEGGTFTVNNTGSFGSVASKPILNYPQVAIVTMERAMKRAIVNEDDAIAVRWMMNVCLSFDHRAIDGREAGNFLATVKQRLEHIALA
jgi:2-oxoisovalerate dehydrogenase E2 component (dihydrolipoyl transacylase)